MEDHNYHKVFIKTEVEDVAENSDYYGKDILSEGDDESSMGETDTNLVKCEPGIKQLDKDEEVEFAIKCKLEMKDEPFDRIDNTLNDSKLDPDPVYSEHEKKNLIHKTDARSIHFEEVMIETSNIIFGSATSSARQVKKAKKNRNIKFKCDKCDYMTSFSYNLKQHKHKHSQVKPFKCNRCPFQTYIKFCLRMHKYVHTDERPFKCDQCDYSGKFKSVLVQHQQTHSKLKRLKCDKCSYRTDRKILLKSHQLVHKKNILQVEKYGCTECGYVTKHKACLTRHQRLHLDHSEWKKLQK